MKSLLINIVLVVLGVVATLTIQNTFFKPEDPNIDALESRIDKIDQELKEAQKIIIDRETAIDNRNERIKKDSVVIMLSGRKYRDSIRNIINPAH